MKEGYRLSIQFGDRDQPVEDNSASSTSFMGTMRRVNHTSSSSRWRHIGETAEHHAKEQINIQKL